MATAVEELYFEQVCGNDGVADVVFVHGLRGSPIETWSFEGCLEADGGFWPKWLERDLPRLNVYTLGYPAGFFAKWAKKEMNLYERAKAVLELLAARGLGARPIAFVGHSLGGLLTKQILRVSAESTDQAWSRISVSCRKVFFIATPHSGSSLATLLKKFAAGFASSHVTTLVEDSNELDQLNESFRNLASKSDLSAHVYYETWKTGNTAIIVGKKSADPGLTGVQPIAVEADHISIAMPRSRDAFLYLSIHRHLKDLMEAFGPMADAIGDSFEFDGDDLGAYGSDRRDLYSKLIAADREHEYELANDHQNKFARQYYRAGLLKNAKDGYDNLLADIDQRFNSLIYHELICKGASTQEVADGIQLHIVEPLKEKYAKNRATALTIMNALYFLTERCHVRWDVP